MTPNLQSIKQRFGIVGNSAMLQNALETAARVASTELSVLIIGESGVGKEVFSKIIHELSPRKHQQFIAINCGAIPEGTINSELFGHEKGAFTGAGETRKGYFETVDGGTIFLDEIGEMPLDTQTHLLRVLENGEFMRVGSSKVLKTNVRVIAATNVNLLDATSRKKFREDLYYRLSTVPIRVPALRERVEDIYLLFRKFATDFAERYHTTPITLDEQARYYLENFPFPGNIRQLKNLTEQMSVLAEEKLVTGDDLLRFLPRETNFSRALVPAREAGDKEPLQEREILYKFLIDIRKDVQELKSFLYEIIRENDLQVTNLPLSVSSALRPYPYTDDENDDDERGISGNNTPNHNGNASGNSGNYISTDFRPYTPPTNGLPNRNNNTPTTILYDGNRNLNTSNGSNGFSTAANTTETEHALSIVSIEDMEKDMIKKALRKFRNRRRDAAEELGISERTLYRKIKQYSIKA